MLATEELDDEALAQFDSSNSFTVELNKENAYYRLHNKRLIFGGLDKNSNSNAEEFEIPRSAMVDLTNLFSQSFPKLKPIRFSESWSGIYHLSLSDLPIVRRLQNAPSVLLNIGYGGTGLAFTFICAPLAAAMAIGSKFQSPEHKRLLDTIVGTHLPIMSGLLFGAGVSAAVIRDLPFRTSGVTA